MYRFNNSLFLSIEFNHEALPLEGRDSAIVESLLITTNVKASLPTCVLNIRDKSGFFKTKCSLVADLPFSIRIGTSEDKMDTFKFRLFVPHESVELEEDLYSLIGLYQAPAYILRSRYTPIKGTSDSVLKQIATDCGLKYDGVPTTDTQTWHPGNQKNHVFVRDIVGHAYVNSTSCMRHGVTGKGELRLRNLTKITKDANTPVFWRGIPPSSSSKDHQIYDLTSSTTSGFSNVISGYAQSLIQQSGIKTITNVIKKLAVSLPNATLPMDAKLSKGIEVSRVSFAPIDGGNTHANYEQASYQNSRLAHLYSNSILFFHGTKTDIDLFDPITVIQQASLDLPADAVSGTYIVTGKAIYLQGTNFYEKFEAVRLGSNVDIMNTQVKR